MINANGLCMLTWKIQEDFQKKHQNGGLSDFKHGMIVVFRQTGVSTSKTVDTPGIFTHSHLQTSYRMVGERKNLQ